MDKWKRELKMHTWIIKTQSHHEIEPFYLKIFLLHHTGQARDREEESNLWAKSNNKHLDTIYHTFPTSGPESHQ